MKTSFKLGGDVRVAAGPVGAGVSREISADMVTFLHSKGVYGGAALDGALISVRGNMNSEYYGKEVSPTEILIRHTVDNAGSHALRDAFAKAADRK